MTLALVSKANSLPSIEKARDLLAHCRSIQEVKKIKAVADAVKSCEMSEDAAREAHAIVLFAKARIGELTAELPKSTKAQAGSRTKLAPKRDALDSEGISRKEAAECERLAEMQKTGDLDRVIKSGAKVTIASAVSMAKLSSSERSEAIASLGDVPDLSKAIRKVKDHGEEEEAPVRPFRSALPFKDFHDTTVRAWITTSLSELLEKTPEKEAQKVSALLGDWSKKFAKKAGV